MKKIIVLILMLFFATNCFAYTANDLSWDGFIGIILEKDSFSPGEKITGQLMLTNEEYYPIIGNTNIIQLSTGTHHYPSQFANENIIKEIVLTEAWTLPREKRVIPFSIEAPSSGGEYNLVVYSWIQKSMFYGGDSILLGPQIQKINVSGEQKERVIIDRRLTGFGIENEIGPVGFPVLPEEEFPANIYLRNNSNIRKENLEMTLLICDWSCALSETIFEKKESIGSLNANESKNFVTSLIAPKIPSAYEIKMILKNNNEIESIYSNRVIVVGGTAKLRKIMLDGLKDQNYIIETIFAGSPDHFTYPSFENFELKIEVFNNNQLIETQKEFFEKIETGEIFGKKFFLNETFFDKICLMIEKDELIFEKECFNVPLQELLDAENKRNPDVINLEWNYNENSKNLEIILTKKNNIINSRIRLIDFEKSLINERIQKEGYYKNNFIIEKGKYTLIVNDFDAKRQQTIELLLGVEDIETNFLEQDIPLEEQPCHGIICEIGTVCDSKPIISKEGDCCLTNCIPSTRGEYSLIEVIPLLFWISIIIFVTTIIFLKQNLKKMRGLKK